MTTSTFGGVTVASDEVGVEVAADAVLGVGPAARTLAWHTPRRRRRRALDLGTGNGIQALLAAAHCYEVVGTDINPRALGYARSNARRNGIGNVEWRLGDLFEPVAGERFDLVVANPPFVVSPDVALQFRDGGADLCARLVAGLDGHLADDGVALVMANWPQRPGRPWWEVPLGWAEPVRADALFLRFGTASPEGYAEQWTQWAPDPPAAAARWLAWFRANGIERLGAGLVVLRRTKGPPRRRALDVPHPVTAPCGDHLEAVLDPPPPTDRVRLVPHARVERAPDPGRYDALGGRRPVDGVAAPEGPVDPAAGASPGAGLRVPAAAASDDGWYVQRVPGLGVRMPVSPTTARRLLGGDEPGVAEELRHLVALGLAVPSA